MKCLPHTDLIPANHAVNTCEVSRFYRSSRSYRNPADRTDPADHIDPADHADPPKKNVQIMQIVHIPSLCRDHADHTDSTQIDHTDPADYTDPADRAHPPINMCRPCRSYRPYIAKDVQIMPIGQILYRLKCTDCTDHTDSTCVHVYEN